MVRGRTPRRTRTRDKKIEKEVKYVKTIRDKRVKIYIEFVRYRRMSREYSRTRGALDKVFETVVSKIGIIIANAALPIIYTRCYVQKIKLKTFSITKALSKPVYQVFREARAYAMKILTPVGRFVISRRGTRVLGNYINMTLKTIAALLQREKKPLDDTVQTIIKLADKFRSLLQRSRYGKLLLNTIMNINELARIIALMRGWLEDWRMIIHIDCTPYYYETGWTKIPYIPYPYIIAKLRDRIAKEYVKKRCMDTDKWCREYRAMWAKDILSACDARVGIAMGTCLKLAIEYMNKYYEQTNYAATYTRLAQKQ